MSHLQAWRLSPASPASRWCRSATGYPVSACGPPQQWDSTILQPAIAAHPNVSFFVASGDYGLLRRGYLPGGIARGGRRGRHEPVPHEQRPVEQRDRLDQAPGGLGQAPAAGTARPSRYRPTSRPTASPATTACAPLRTCLLTPAGPTAWTPAWPSTTPSTSAPPTPGCSRRHQPLGPAVGRHGQHRRPGPRPRRRPAPGCHCDADGPLRRGQNSPRATSTTSPRAPTSFYPNHAGPGYDLVTGLGSPRANLLLPDLAAFGLASKASIATQPPPSVAAGHSFGIIADATNSFGVRRRQLQWHRHALAGDAARAGPRSRRSPCRSPRWRRHLPEPVAAQEGQWLHVQRHHDRPDVGHHQPRLGVFTRSRESATSIRFPWPAAWRRPSPRLIRIATPATSSRSPPPASLTRRPPASSWSRTARA